MEQLCKNSVEKIFQKWTEAKKRKFYLCDNGVKLTAWDSRTSWDSIGHQFRWKACFRIQRKKD